MKPRLSIRTRSGQDISSAAILKTEGGRAFFTLKEGAAEDAFVCLELEYEGSFSRDGYLMMPGAVYNGNQGRFLDVKYPPFLPEGEMRQKRPSGLPYITDIPRLPEIHRRSGDMSTPAVCFYDSKKGSAFFLFGVHNIKGEYTGFHVYDGQGGGVSRVEYTWPSVRPYAYSMCNSKAPSPDRGVTIAAGETVELPFMLKEVKCPNLAAFFRLFFENRRIMGEDASRAERADFEGLMKVYEDKYNEYNFCGEGFYKSGVSDNMYQYWQSGWTGGGMFNLALYKKGSGLTRERVLQSLDFYNNKFQNKKGFYAPVYYKGKIYGDDFAHPENAGVLMTRKQADMAYYYCLLYKEAEKEYGSFENFLSKGLNVDEKEREAFKEKFLK